jgi:hypothetical protein
MYRRKVIVTTAAVFAIGVAFAAQPTSEGHDSHCEVVGPGTPWIPGTDMLMSAHEAHAVPLAPPR